MQLCLNYWNFLGSVCLKYIHVSSIKFCSESLFVEIVDPKDELSYR